MRAEKHSGLKPGIKLGVPLLSRHDRLPKDGAKRFHIAPLVLPHGTQQHHDVKCLNLFFDATSSKAATPSGQESSLPVPPRQRISRSLSMAKPIKKRNAPGSLSISLISTCKPRIPSTVSGLTQGEYFKRLSRQKVEKPPASRSTQSLGRKVRPEWVTPRTSTASQECDAVQSATPSLIAFIPCG